MHQELSSWLRFVQMLHRYCNKEKLFLFSHLACWIVNNIIFTEGAPIEHFCILVNSRCWFLQYIAHILHNCCSEIAVFASLLIEMLTQHVKRFSPAIFISPALMFKLFFMILLHLHQHFMLQLKWICRHPFEWIESRKFLLIISFTKILCLMQQNFIRRRNQKS